MLDSLLTIPNELTQTERERIVEYFKNMSGYERCHTNHFDINLEGRPTFFVKYGLDVMAEASTQSFFYALAQKDESAPQIPRVYDAFQDGYGFFVMEKIELPILSTCEISEDDAIKSVASAIKWLLAQLPSVPTSIFGRISSEPSCVWHRFFKDHEAPVCFAHANALTKYVNKAFSRCYEEPKRTVSFPDELAIYHSDISKDNFLYDIKTGKICIIDFQHIGVLPEPFQTYAFFNTGSRFTAAVGRHLGYRPSRIANQLTRAANMLQMTGNASLNLDKFGEPIPKKNGELSVIQNAVIKARVITIEFYAFAHTMLPTLLTVPDELSQTERERIVEYYENIVEKKNFYAKYFDIDLEGRPTFFVKHGLDGLVEASTQSFFYNLAQKDESAPRIPKVYDAFRQNGHCFFVMEKIELPTLSTCEISEDDAVKSVASAIEWLFAQLPSVPTSIFGRISSEPSCARHEFFKDQEAPVCFANSDALTKYVNKVRISHPFADFMTDN
ncbi:hypothetical protein Clacol_003985 [Clathrus columnatus]|uniref:Aminoglycoside phosphotransferase domain-containing protein n=1 Tax=Clathrus columnatus TaxID=1419009 RepID=A0AAV5A9T5_9AGAM|nr:hypothetical protein Clacol_003985 [Clathrus columnatus]